MAVQKGSEVLVGREDSSFSGSYNLIGGQQSGDLEVTDQTADFTHKTSTGLWQEIMDGGTSRAVRVNMTGVVVDDTELDAVFAAVMGSGTRHQNYAFLMPGFGMIAATFHNPQFGASGEVNAPEGFTLQGQSAGDITFVPGVTDRYAMQASVVLDFTASSYWVSGAHATDFASVSGVSVTRASTKTDAGGWDFTNGSAVGTLTEYASGVAAIHPTAGLLPEEGSTNENRNPRCEGAVVGAPGTLPTHWVNNGAVSTEVVATGVTNGWPYIDVRFNGTPGGNPSLQFDAATQVAAADGEDWTASANISLQAGDTTNISNVYLSIISRDSGGAFLSQEQVEIGDAIDAENRRFFKSRTLSPAATAYVQAAVQIIWDGSGAIDITLRIYAPHLEQKAYPTSPVFPVAGSPAAATRAEDDVQLATGAWYSSTAFTMFAQWVPNVVAGFGYIATLSDGTSDNTNGLGLSSDDEPRFIMVTAGSTVSQNNGASAVTVGSEIKHAVAYSVDNVAVSLEGDSQFTDSSATAGTFTKLQLGAYREAGSAQQNGYIKCLRIWPKRLTNAELESLVGN